MTYYYFLTCFFYEHVCLYTFCDWRSSYVGNIITPPPKNSILLGLCLIKLPPTSPCHLFVAIGSRSSSHVHLPVSATCLSIALVSLPHALVVVSKIKPIQKGAASPAELHNPDAFPSPHMPSMSLDHSATIPFVPRLPPLALKAKLVHPPHKPHQMITWREFDYSMPKQKTLYPLPPLLFRISFPSNRVRLRILIGTMLYMLDEFHVLMWNSTWYFSASPCGC